MKVKLAKIIDRFIILPICYLLAPIALFNSNKLENPKDIAIIRLWAIGESTLTLPMIKRIKLKYPNAKITIICSDKNKELFENQKFVDRVTDYKSKEILKSYRKYDVIIDAEPFLNISALLSSLLGKSSIGYSQKKSSFLYKNKIEYKDGIHVANNFIRLASPLNIKGDELETLEQIKTNEEVSKKIDELVKNIKKPRVGICITTGGTALSRRWPINKWAEISKYLFREFKANIFIIGGKEDKSIIDDFKDKLEFPIFSTYNNSLKENIELLNHLDLMISSDTGPMHLAAAQGAPTIGLFCPNTPIRFRPLNKKSSFVYKPVLDQPCINVFNYEIPDCENHNHMSKIGVEDVINEIKKLDKKWKILSNK